MPKIALTDLTIRSLKSDKRTDYWDAKFPSFGIRIGPRAKTFLVKHQNSRRTIGSYPAISLQEARRQAFVIKSVPLPVQEEKEPTKTFKEAMQDFETIHCSQKKPRTRADYARILKTHYQPKFENKLIDAITAADTNKITDKLISTPSERNHAISVGRTFFNFCVRRGYRKDNPFANVEIPKLKSRNRVLTLDELKILWNATEEPIIFNDLVRFLILTGQRSGEICHLHKDWFDGKLITFPPEAVKNSREHKLPIGPYARSMLKRRSNTYAYFFPARGSEDEKPFNGRSKCKKALDKKLGKDFKPWRLHDLRRTFATTMASIGVTIEITEKLLNHVSGTFSGIVPIYQHHDFMPEMKAALEKYETFLLASFQPG